MKRLPAAAKINLALVVGPTREDGMHEIVTVMQRIDLCDSVEVAPAASLTVDGFRKDTIVRAALERLAAAAGVEPRWYAKIRKRIPLAAGLGGGSADAAAALVLANPLLDEPLPAARLTEVAAGIGADVPFFLEPGPKLAEGTGERLTGSSCRRTSGSSWRCRGEEARPRPRTSTLASTRRAARTASRTAVMRLKERSHRSTVHATSRPYRPTTSPRPPADRGSSTTYSRAAPSGPT